MEEMGTIILNSFSEEPIYYIVSEENCDCNVAIIKANYDEDCVAKLVNMINSVTNADKIIDIEFLNGDDESFVFYEVSYIKNGEEEIRTFYLEVTDIF